MYTLYAPIQATYKESQSLKGLAKIRYNKKHKESPAKSPELNDSIGKEPTKITTELVYAEEGGNLIEM